MLAGVVVARYVALELLRWGIPPIAAGFVGLMVSAMAAVVREILQHYDDEVGSWGDLMADLAAWGLGAFVGVLPWWV